MSAQLCDGCFGADAGAGASFGEEEGYCLGLEGVVEGRRGLGVLLEVRAVGGGVVY